MNPLRALIVDDEMHARENLRMLIEEFCSDINIVGQAGGVNEALSQINNLNPDVVFLDIRMPSGEEGFEVLEKSKDLNFQVVFVTAFKDYAVRAFNANAVHYILKPIDIDDLMAAANKLSVYQKTLVENVGSRSDYNASLRELTHNMKSNSHPAKLTLYHAKGFKIVNCSDIIRLEADGTCTHLFFKDGSRYTDTKNLKVFEDLLEPQIFCRVHKSFMINLLELSEYVHTDGGEAIMSDASRVPIARARLTDFLAAVKSL
jgi:two-component system, LytTR family, response regulator